MAEDSGIPRNSDKILFAVDFVHYVMHQYADVEILPYRVEEYRQFIYNEFNETIREAIQFFEITEHTHRICVRMRTNIAVNINMYKTYAKFFRDQFLSKDFDAYKFLYYCTNLACLAAFCYTYEVSEAPHLAISNIISVLEVFDMSNGGWDELNSTAEKLVYYMAREPRTEL